MMIHVMLVMNRPSVHVHVRCCPLYTAFKKMMEREEKLKK